MNNPNPFVPQGSLAEQKNKKRARLKVAVFSIFGINFLLVAVVLLIQGCGNKSGQTDAKDATTALNDTNKTPTGDLPSLNDPALASNSNVPPSTASTSAPPVTPTPAVVSNPAPTPAPLPTTVSVPPVAAPPTPTPAPAGPVSEYVVAKGDSFYTIGKKLGVSMAAIKAANPTVVPTKIKVGQKLQIPSGTSSPVASATPDSGEGTVYIVKTGDNLTKIAHTHGTTVKAIRLANNLKTDAIKVGAKLKLPAKSAPTAADLPPMATPVAPMVATSTVTTPTVGH